MKAYIKGESLYFRVSNVWIRTGVKVSASGWNHAKQSVRAWVSGADILNSELARQRAEITEAVLRIKKDGEPISNAAIERRRRPEPVEIVCETSVSSLLIRYAEQHKKTLRKNYLRKFKPVADHLSRFTTVMASQFSVVVMQSYITYLLELEDEDGEPLIQNNTVHDHVRKIRRVMQYYGSQGVKVHHDCHKFKFKYIKPKPVWLDTGRELALLEQFIPLAEYQVFKDEFLFRCYSGLRFSDCQQLQPHHFIVTGDDVYIDFTAIKTSLNQNILLSSKAAALAKKWGYHVPKLYLSDCNERIKPICRAAKIKTKTEKVRFRGSERVVNVFEKWELVTTHVARRTFARAWLDLGGDAMKLMKYMGHSSIEQTLSYAGYETVEVNQEMKRLFG